MFILFPYLFLPLCQEILLGRRIERLGIARTRSAGDTKSRGERHTLSSDNSPFPISLTILVKSAVHTASSPSCRSPHRRMTAREISRSTEYSVSK